MGFINNHKDNFLPSGNPWGDDNVTVYNFPNTDNISFDVSSMDFDNLRETYNEMQDSFSSLPPCPAKNRLKRKMQAVSEELKKRNAIEDIARIDRDDNFERVPRTIKEDVVTPIPTLEEVAEPVVDIPPTESTTDTDEILQDILEEMEDTDTEDLQDKPIVIQKASLTSGKDFDNFLIASLIIITLIAVTKK